MGIFSYWQKKVTSTVQEVYNIKIAPLLSNEDKMAPKTELVGNQELGGRTSFSSDPVFTVRAYLQLPCLPSTWITYTCIHFILLFSL